MKFNMGCGFSKLPGYVNIDKYSACSPDMQMDLEILPWEIETEQADEVVFNHSLEHLGQETETFLGIIKELYRICKPDARVLIRAPHPRHDDFLDDPTHVRRITPNMLALFSKKKCNYWREVNAANSPLALYLDVDFETANVVEILEEDYYEQLTSGEVTREELEVMMLERNNIVKEYHIELTAIK